ncbi:MAG: alpha/beta hydrolase family protein [Termitinemataceae bacterium]|nr:MAG: alpha/beta hydrolase family protein [Termitinemataceae bacterium]
MKYAQVSILFLFIAGYCFAAKVEPVIVFSDSMNIGVETMIISPQEPTGPSSVIYLLHGYGGDASTWIRISPDLKKWSDNSNIIFVCPNGKNNWWFDSPMHGGLRYETFVAKELVAYIESNYNCMQSSKYRAISGYDFGGNGALYIASKNTGVFKNAGSISGTLDLFRMQWNELDHSPGQDFNLSTILGNQNKYRSAWQNHSMLYRIDQIKNAQLNLIIDCGIYGNQIFDVNDELHNILTKKKIPHTYISGADGQTVLYWRKAIEYQILFFISCFN